jgi:hypothetical protein
LEFTTTQTITGNNLCYEIQNARHNKQNNKEMETKSEMTKLLNNKLAAERYTYEVFFLVLMLASSLLMSIYGCIVTIVRSA